MDPTISPGFASIPSLSAATDSEYAGVENLPDPDEDFVLFPEEDEDNASTHFHPNVAKVHSAQDIQEEGDFILGTIIIRIVAARGLVNPNQYANGFGGVFRNNSAPATVNPYASVKFGRTTQRTSNMYSTRNPVWPRDEVFFMDVSLPVSRATHSLEDLSLVPDEITPSLSLNENNNHASATLENPFHYYKKPANTTLTVALFHSDKINRKQKMYDKQNILGDSDDVFLGMASIDLTRLFTGKVTHFDQWLPLTGTSTDIESRTNLNSRSSRKEGNKGASLRIICEYEVSDLPPKPGDVCRFTSFCHPRDLYPLDHARSYRIDRVKDDGNLVFLSYESQEGWSLSFQVHKNMLICEERHISALNTAQDELQTLGERLSVSPLVTSIAETAGKVVDDGVVGIAEGIVSGSAFVLNRWFKGGVDVAIQDFLDITNIDGRHNVESINQDLDLNSATSAAPSLADDDNQQGSFSNIETEALPNMPSCPITGFPMVDPVVAADGHTYERIAITRWLKTSDKSPMTGSVLPHKGLVSNYGLVSSIQEATAHRSEEPSGPHVK
mmetsp:Transcript_11075/g.26595  ORF Transcript_11075/g.26595 Transcript_11075/m.26595 type:complete len:556 (-) Transcript_11075:191-1858(-)